jgi:transposase
MGKRLKIIEHLPLHEVERRYKKAQDGTAGRHWQVIWRLQGGQSSAQVADETGLSLEWVRVLARRYNAQGPSALGDQRRRHPGKAPVLDEAGLGALQEALLQAVPAGLGGGLWNGPKVVAWIEGRVGRKVAPRLGSVYLHKAGFSCQAPRPRHEQADPLAQEAFKKHWQKK